MPALLRTGPLWTVVVLCTIGPSLPVTAEGVHPCSRFFELSEVRLLDGPFKTAMGLNGEYLLSLDPDRFLSGVRTNAGLDPKAPRYGGWESQGVAGQSLGHYMTALSQQYQATGDEKFKRRVDYIVDELAYCQAQDSTGYVAAIPNGKEEFEGLKARGGRLLGWVPWYTMHKLFQGLRDAHRFCDNEKAKESSAIQLTGWARCVASGTFAAVRSRYMSWERFTPHAAPRVC